MDNLLILGSGQYGNIVYEIAQATKRFEKIDFLDDSANKAIGKICDAPNFLKTYKYAIVAIGNSQIRLKFLNQMEEIGFQIPALCSPLAYISPSASISCGSIVEPMAVINSNSKIGKGCIISAGAVVNHDAVVETGCQIDCNAVVCASQVVPKHTKIICGCVYSAI